MNMRRTRYALLCGSCCAIAATALAQTSSTDTPQQQTEQLMRELERARHDVEKAAQEIAGLSIQLAGPLAAELSTDITQHFDAMVGRSFLGVVIESTELGARVTAVTPNGPAASAGIQVGDTIVAIDGDDLAQQPSAVQMLLARMAGVAPGETVNLRVMRGGDYRDIAVAMPADGRRWFNFEMPQVWLDGDWNPWTTVFARSQPWSDFEFVALTPELGEYFGTDKGLLVVRAPDGDALGFRDGDVILDIGGREPQSPEHALRIFGSFEPGESLRVSIMRKRVRETLEIKIPGETADSA